VEQEFRRDGGLGKGKDAEADGSRVEHQLNGARSGAQQERCSVDPIPQPTGAVVRSSVQPNRGPGSNLG
jgi:hypothetical protein